MTDYLETSLLGMLRGTSVQLCVHPLQTIKTRLQGTPTGMPHAEVIRSLFQQKGVGGFYSGLVPKLIATNIKQVWCWQVIQSSPRWLEGKGVAPLPSQMLTGIAIAAIDASLSTPLETAAIRAMLAEQKLPMHSLFSNCWNALGTNSTRLAVQWTTFLTAQSYFKSQYSQEHLTGMQMLAVGIKTAGVVSIASAPFDAMNTLVQVANSTLKRTPLQLYRGAGYSTMALIIHNFASVALIVHLEKQAT